MLNKAEILEAQDLPREEVQIPEWKGSVYVQTMTADAKDTFEGTLLEGGKATIAGIRAKLAVATVVDEAGNCLFGLADVEALGKKSGKALDRIFTVAQRLNAISDADLKEMEKNSSSGPGAASPSA